MSPDFYLTSTMLEINCLSIIYKILTMGQT